MVEKIIPWERFQAMKKSREEMKNVPQRFQVGEYYINSKVGELIHILYDFKLSNNSVTIHDSDIFIGIVYLVETNLRELSLIPYHDNIEVTGWGLTTKEVFMEFIPDVEPDNEPPEPSAA